MVGQPIRRYTNDYKFNNNRKKWLILQHHA